MKYHTDNHIGELRSAAENGKIIYYEDARPMYGDMIYKKDTRTKKGGEYDNH